MLQAAAKAKAEPPGPPKNSKWTCKLCLITIAPKDITAHQQGKRHLAALAKVDESSRAKLNSDCSRAGAYDTADTGVKRGNIKAVPKSTSSSQSTSQKPEASARPPSATRGTIKASSSFNHPPKTQKKKEKATTNPKKATKNAVPPPNSAEIHDQQLPHARRASVNDNDPLAAFFGLYRPFKYNRHASSHDEYRRLCAFRNWPSRGQDLYHAERDEAWEGFRIAMVKAFNMTFGDDENDIEAWGSMCVLVGLERIPETLLARRKVRE